MSKEFVKNLVIVESPAKAKTIEKFLGKDFIVKSSFGHIRDLSKKDSGVDIKNGFKPNYEIDTDKIDVIKELRRISKSAETIWLASDEDREGEAIAWHLYEALELQDSNTKRIVFNEITESAIKRAINNPRKIDKNLVDAQQARRVLDRLVGFELSPVLWKKVKGGLSAGRVQSVAVRLIVDRENEIKSFVPEEYFKVSGVFKTQKNQTLKTELSTKFENEKLASEFLNLAKSAKFYVDLVDTKPGKKSPSAPFTTSTLQQEASRKLNFSVSRTMVVAQKLYEGGHITYMRTDSVNLSETAIEMAKEVISSTYGANYSQPRQFTTKSKGAQEAHEAIRPAYMHKVSPDGLSNDEKRLYDLIRKRTIASQMSDAIVERTTIKIKGSNFDPHFVAKGEVIKFDGFLAVYFESKDDEEDDEIEGLLPSVAIGEELQRDLIDAVQKYTHHLPRYTEASLVKKLEELGIGRPSTYAPTLSNIQQREYVVKETREGSKREYCILKLVQQNISRTSEIENHGAEKDKIFPTDIGSVVCNFLTENFDDILDYNFTANIEREFDEIAHGERPWGEMLGNFYSPFHDKVEETTKNAERASGERILGVDPVSGKNVVARIGRYGSIVQIGDANDEEKPKFAGIPKENSIEKITLDEALKLFDLPKEIGLYENEVMTVAIGRFGPYIKHNSAFYSIPKAENPLSISVERAIEIIEEKRLKEKNKFIRVYDSEPNIQVLNGPYGAYITDGEYNYKIPKGTEPTTLSLEDCKKIIADNEGKAKRPVRKSKAASKTVTKSSNSKSTSKKSINSSTSTSKKTSVRRTKKVEEDFGEEEYIPPAPSFKKPNVFIRKKADK